MRCDDRWVLVRRDVHEGRILLHAVVRIGCNLRGFVRRPKRWFLPVSNGGLRRIVVLRDQHRRRRRLLQRRVHDTSAPGVRRQSRLFWQRLQDELHGRG